LSMSHIQRLMRWEWSIRVLPTSNWTLSISWGPDEAFRERSERSPDERSDIRVLRFIDPAYRCAHAGCYPTKFVMAGINPRP
jgi:hypothetical protein